MTDTFGKYPWRSFDDMPMIGQWIWIYNTATNQLSSWEFTEWMKKKSDYVTNCIDKEIHFWQPCYVPDLPNKIKLEHSDTLKGCSNNYILELEKRIEALERENE